MGDWADDLERLMELEEDRYDMIHCTGCDKEVGARLTDGSEIYPHRPDLAGLQFYIHDVCGAFVGVHRKSTRPLGSLATREVKVWRKNIHDILDSLWKSKKITRNAAYQYIGKKIGQTYHTAEIASVEEGIKIYGIVKMLKEELDPGPWNK